MILQTDNLLAGYFHDLLMSFSWKIQWFCVLVAALLTLLHIFTAYGLQILFHSDTRTDTMKFMLQELQTNINLESSSKFDLITVISPSSGSGEVQIL